MTKMMEEKCDAYKVIGILGCRRGKMQQLQRRIREKKADIDKKRMRKHVEER